MVKKKKIFKRVTALAGAVLLLLVAVAPALMGRADAMPALPADGSFTVPDVAYLGVPLDRFTWDYNGITFENPFYSFAFGDFETGYSSSIDLLLYGFGDAYPRSLEFWYLDDVVIDFSNVGLVHYASCLFKGSAGNSNSFSMSNSASFVISFLNLSDFLTHVGYYVAPYYEYTGSVSISGLYPVQADNGNWSFEPFSVSTSLDFVNETPDPQWIGALDPLESADIDLRLSSEDLLLVDSLTISFNVFCPLEKFTLYGAPDASDQRLRLVASYDPLTCSFAEFRERYPFYIVNSVGSESFDLTLFLKDSVGSFMSTQIIPGISFGGLLAVSLGLSMTVVFLKFFS